MMRSLLAILFLALACTQPRKTQERPPPPQEAMANNEALQKAGPLNSSKILEVNQCGSGTLDQNESCDDGNRRGGDGCSPNCRKEAVGLLSARAVDSEGKQYPLPGSFQVDEWDSARIVRFENFVAMFEGQPLRLAIGSPPTHPIPMEFSDQIEHFAGFGHTFVVSLSNGQIWEMVSHLDPHTACNAPNLRQPGVLSEDGKRWCQWRLEPQEIADLNVRSFVTKDGKVWEGGKWLNLPPTQSFSVHTARCALLRSGELACWGDNNHGEVGYVSEYYPGGPEEQGYWAAKSPPKKYLKFPSPVTKVEAGQASYALTEGGELWCWGHCGELPFVDTGEPQPYWHRMMADDPPRAGGNPKPVGASTMPSAPLKLPEGCVPKDFRSSCVICEDGCLKCWHDKESLEKAECVTY